jgi:hypothetical protein
VEVLGIESRRLPFYHMVITNFGRNAKNGGDVATKVVEILAYSLAVSLFKWWVDIYRRQHNMPYVVEGWNVVMWLYI